MNIRKHFFASELSNEYIVMDDKTQPDIVIRRNIASQVNTPSPYELTSVLFGNDIPKQIVYPMLTGGFVETANMLARAMADTLPIIEEDDHLIDDLISKKYANATVSKLTRKIV